MNPTEYVDQPVIVSEFGAAVHWGGPYGSINAAAGVSPPPPPPHTPPHAGSLPLPAVPPPNPCCCALQAPILFPAHALRPNPARSPAS